MANWWEEPFRVVQTNLREIDAVLDASALVRDLKELHANAVLINTGGIVSFFPTTLPFQHRSDFLAEGADMIGDVVEEAHRHGIRVMSRFDLSKCHRHVYEDHPDWFFVDRDGKPEVYNELYQACLSGPYYQEKSFEILGEVLERYDIDGVFFNMFGYPTRDYSRVYHGVCHCENCRRRFLEFSGMELPREESWSDPAYERHVEFRAEMGRDVAERMHAFIRSKRPDVALFQGDWAEVRINEVNNAIGRPLPLWRYQAGEFAKRNRTTSSKPAVLLSVAFVDIPYRFSHDYPTLMGLHLAQSLANAANLHFYVIGTTEQLDRKQLPLVKSIYAFAEKHAGLYANLQSMAEVALVHPQQSATYYGKHAAGGSAVGSFRGWYRALAEQHIPFEVFSDHLLDEPDAHERLSRYRALLLPNVACLSDPQCAVLDEYVRRGGVLIATFETSLLDEKGDPREAFGLKCLGASSVRGKLGYPEAWSSYFVVDDRALLPGWAETDLIPLVGEYLYVETDATERALPLIPPCRYGPPEKCWGVPGPGGPGMPGDGVERRAALGSPGPNVAPSEHPGLILNAFGDGRTAYMPWAACLQYHEHSRPEHSALLAGLLAELTEGPPLVTTDAHPSVEVTMHRQEGTRRVLVHLINFSGHQDRAYHPPVTMRDVSIRVRVPNVTRAWAASTEEELGVECGDGSVRVLVPTLRLFEVVVLETGEEPPAEE